MKLKSILVMLLAAPLIALAGVNPKNGNFYVTYQDVSLNERGHELNISRTYNSKSAELGWFGWGWGSDYETHLFVLPDGSAAINENGAGLTNYYRTDNEFAIKAGVKRIVEAAKKRERLTPAAADQLAAQLLGDEDLRLRKSIKYGIHTELRQGDTLGDFCGKASLTRVAEGYRRIDCNRFGDTESAIDTFDFQGRLIRHELEDGYAVAIRYADDGSATIQDTLGQRIALTWTPEGRVASVKTNKESIKYLYDARQDLVEAETAGGNTYRYAYDDNHNLTRITYIDDSNMFISYSPRVSGMADSVTERSGQQQTYVYRTDPNDPNHYWTRHTIISPSGQRDSREYEYKNEVSPTGAAHLSSISQSGDGSYKETKLDSQGRVIRKVSDEGVVSQYAYHPQSGKLIEVMVDDFKTEFEYNGEGELIRAKNSSGQTIDLYYSAAKKIRRMVEVSRADKTRRELTFEYNAIGKLTEITLVGTGKITVEYDYNGTIDAIYSDNGPEMAVQVSKAFHNLMDVVKIAGIRI